MKLRFILALWAAKLSQPLLKITGHKGTNFPGELALKLCPEFLRYIAKPARIVAVTGTDGKTSVTNLICDMLEASGQRVLSNRAGANTNAGVSTCLLSGATIFNRTRFDVAALEVDERSAARVYPYVKPQLIAVTNLFRDSIMRNGHPEFIAAFLTANLPAESKLVLNADDLISSSVAPDNPRVYFGLDRLPTDVTDCINRLNDLRICPKCAGKLEYEYRRYHHIGRARCADCGFRSPDYDYEGKDVDLANMTITVADKSGSQTYRLLSDSIFNIYNLLTAVAVLREMGMDHQTIAGLAEKIDIVSSRFQAEKVGQVEVVMQMAKDRNALACSRAFDYVASRPGEKEILLMMNNLSDEVEWSENVCWLYDCDFEFLNNEQITHIVTTGPRGKDYNLRLRLAGVPEERISWARKEMDAADKLYLRPGSSVYILYGADNRSLDMGFRVREKVVKLAEEAGK